MTKVPEWIKPEHLEWLDQFAYDRVGDLCSHWMRTYAARHNLNQDEIDAHKEAMRQIRPQMRIAERLRIERLLAIKEAECEEMREALSDYAEDSAKRDLLDDDLFHRSSPSKVGQKGA